MLRPKLLFFQTITTAILSGLETTYPLTSWGRYCYQTQDHEEVTQTNKVLSQRATTVNASGTSVEQLVAKLGFEKKLGWKR